MINRNPHPLPPLPSEQERGLWRQRVLLRDWQVQQRRRDLRALRAIVAIVFVASVAGAYVAGGIVATREYAQDVSTAYDAGSQAGCAGR